MSQQIFTLDARINSMLNIVQSYFGLDRVQMLREINAYFSALLEILKAKRIDYSSLKNALVPRPDRIEAAFVFDRSEIKSGWYGLEVFERILPALDRNATHSVLCGDLRGEADMQDCLYKAFSQEVTLARSCTWRRSNQFHIVYINNLTEQRLSNLRDALSQYVGYIGLVNCYAPSFLKKYFSLIL